MTDKLYKLKQEFKIYLIKKYPNANKDTINTYIGDAFYVYRHELELGIHFFDLLKSIDRISDFKNNMLEQQTNRHVKYPKNSSNAYISGLKRLYCFFYEKYHGVENFINWDCKDILKYEKYNTYKNKQMSVIDEIEEFIKDFPVGYEFSTTWFKKELNKKYNRSEGSYIPSDYCYNRKNKGINYDKQPHYFLYMERNKYKYVGKDYVYNGEIEYNPRKKINL